MHSKPGRIHLSQHLDQKVAEPPVISFSWPLSPVESARRYWAVRYEGLGCDREWLFLQISSTNSHDLWQSQPGLCFIITLSGDSSAESGSCQPKVDYWQLWTRTRRIEADVGTGCVSFLPTFAVPLGLSKSAVWSLTLKATRWRRLLMNLEKLLKLLCHFGAFLNWCVAISQKNYHTLNLFQFRLDFFTPVFHFVFSPETMK